MSRKLFLPALLIVGLHVVEVLWLGKSIPGAVLANSLQISAALLSAVMCYFAFRRSQGASRIFWLMITFSLSTWVIANCCWMYYEDFLRVAPPTPSITRFLFAAQNLFLVVALFQDEERDSPRFDLEAFLDFAQVAIVFFLLYFALYYVEALKGNPDQALNHEAWTAIGETTFLAALAAFRAFTARTKKFRRLFGGLMVYASIYALTTNIAEYYQSIRGTPTGTFFDLGWTLPLLVPAFWANSWQEQLEDAPVRVTRSKTLGQLVVNNGIHALAPMIVLYQIAELGPEWRLTRYSLLALSFVCYSARLILIQFRQDQSSEAALTRTLAMDKAVDGMAIVDSKGIFTYINESYARMFGYGLPKDVVGQPWQNVARPEDSAGVEPAIAESLTRTGSWFGSITVHPDDRTAVEVEMAISALPTGGVVCVSRDLVERRKAEAARAVAETRYWKLVEQVAAITYIAHLGAEGQWLYVSPQVETILGYTPAEWLADSTHWMRHIPEEDHQAVLAAEEASKQGMPFQAEYRIKRKDGKLIWVSDTGVVIDGGDNHSVMEGLLLDVTERKNLEHQLQQSRKMEAVGRLAGGIAHDFNNLLTIIHGYTELALRQSANQPELRSEIERIGDASERAANLVRQLLAFSRRQVLQPKVVDLNAIVLGLDKLLRRLMDENVEMQTIVGSTLGRIKADPAQIEQVIMNLVVNARDAMPNGGRLTIETSNVNFDTKYTREHVTVAAGKYVMLAVTDTGVGMDVETQTHIFEPFYTTKSSASGTGLGLSTVYGIVKQSGGYIWVYSERGKGTTFKVYLPMVTEPGAAPEIPVVRVGETRGSETVLLVEDEPAVRELTRMILAGQGYTVIEAAGAIEAKNIAMKDGAKVDLLLTDVVMPGMSGRDLAKEVTQLFPRARVLYMSGYTFNVIAHGGMLEEGIDFLQKPFTPATLLRKVRDVLDSADFSGSSN
jgi:PAS domain S-box-containing protein